MAKTALVTGGCRGIGLGIVQSLTDAGYSAAITGSQPEESYAATLEKLRSSGQEILYLQSDLADPEASRRSIEKIIARFGRLDVLVNNAGVAPKVRADLLEMTEESYDRVVNTNTRGTMFMTQAAARQMLAQDMADHCRGRIVNITSISSAISSTNRGEYCVSKAGISMLTALYADRLASDGIFVYEIRPGIIKTDMTAGVREKYDKLFADGAIPIARWGLPQDIGRAVTALCAGGFTYTTGQVLFVDGGMHIQRL